MVLMWWGITKTKKRSWGTSGQAHMKAECHEPLSSFGQTLQVLSSILKKQWLTKNFYLSSNQCSKVTHMFQWKHQQAMWCKSPQLKAAKTVIQLTLAGSTLAERKTKQRRVNQIPWAHSLALVFLAVALVLFFPPSWLPPAAACCWNTNISR